MSKRLDLGIDGVEYRVGAVDIGGSKIAVAIVRADGVLLAQTECETAAVNGFDSAMKRIEDMLRGLGAEGLRGIGVGCPGPLDPATGELLEVGTLPGWQGRNLCEDLGRRFGVTVAVENDADAATLGEAAWGSGRGCSRFLYVTVSTGIGGGLVLDRKLYRGAYEAHPEFGHQVIGLSGPLCYCGLHGCWESLASGLAMTAWMRSQSMGAMELPASEICALARGAHSAARETVERERKYLALGLANLVTLFAPERIALGGGVMKSADLFLEPVRALVRGLCTQVPAARTEIVAAELGNDAGLLGAAQCWLQRFGNSQKDGVLTSTRKETE